MVKRTLPVVIACIMAIGAIIVVLFVLGLTIKAFFAGKLFTEDPVVLVVLQEAIEKREMKSFAGDV